MSKRTDRAYKARRLRRILKNTFEPIVSKIAGRRFNTFNWKSGPFKRMIAHHHEIET